MPIGADTEVRPPAPLVLDPCRAMGGGARIGGSGLRGVCPFGREMSVNGGCGGPVALGATGWKPIVLPAGGRLVEGGVTMRKGLCRALWNPCRGSGRVGDGCPGVPLSRNPRLPS